MAEAPEKAGGVGCARIDLEATLDDVPPNSSVVPRCRGLIVGQAPPAPLEELPSGYMPFQGMPERRLARLAGLQSAALLWSAFDRLDLLGWCPGPKDRKSYHMLDAGYRKHRCDGHRFPMRHARLAAGRLVRFGHLAERYAIVVLCGRLVAACFGLKIEGKLVPWMEESGGIRYLVMPHPSGVSHYWNDRASWHRAAGAFRASMRVLGLCAPPPGSEHGRVASQATTPGSSGAPTVDREDDLSAALLKRHRLAKTGARHAPKWKARRARAFPERQSERVVRSRFFAEDGVGKAVKPIELLASRAWERRD